MRGTVASLQFEEQRFPISIVKGTPLVVDDHARALLFNAVWFIAVMCTQPDFRDQYHYIRG